jgi:hypothetical protein
MSRMALKVPLALAKAIMLAYLTNIHVYTHPEKGPCFLLLD